jgi:hypothetical protein
MKVHVSTRYNKYIYKKLKDYNKYIYKKLKELENNEDVSFNALKKVYL